MSTQVAAKDVQDHSPVDPVPGEFDYYIDDVEGSLPDGLRGTLYRNGPGRMQVGNQLLGHLFDGDGMLSMFSIDGGRVRYRNRYVRTKHYDATLRNPERGIAQPGFGTLKRGGPLANFLRLPANVANTSVVYHGEKLFALWEGGKPYELNADTLDTRGTYDFDGQLKWLGAFSAHPKIDPITGDMYNFALEFVPLPVLRCYRVDSNGRLHRMQRVPLPSHVFNHDFALTEKHMVFVIDPIKIGVTDVLKMSAGLQTVDKSFSFDEKLGTTVILVPRDGGKPIISQTESLLHIHMTNAYEDHDHTVIQFIEFTADWDTVSEAFRSIHKPAEELEKQGVPFGGPIVSMRVSKNGSIFKEPITSYGGEFPQLDQRMVAKKHRYTYFMTAVGQELVNAIVKVDHAAAHEECFVLPADCAPSEPIFVPRSAAADEDDGWLLTVIYDAALHRAKLVILDAQDIEAGPLYVGTLRHHLPPSFHGTFVARVADPGPLEPAKLLV